MVTMTTPLPSGVSTSAATRRPPRRDKLTTKEPKGKSAKVQFSHSDWFASEMSAMVDNLCQKMYESISSRLYAKVYDFCDEYGDVVIDRRKVEDPKERSRDLDLVLGHAEMAGRVLVIEAGYGRCLIHLSSEEEERQREQAVARQAERNRKWEERRRRKAHWAVG